MRRKALALAAAAVAILIIGAEVAEAQKSGGTLRVHHRDSPASMSIHEEGTVGVIMPMMGVFNNLMIYDQHTEKTDIGTIMPELATGWAWNADVTALTVTLRDGVRWHDGQPFTSRDVKCTFDLLSNQGKEKLRLNYRESWWTNIAGTDVNGDREATLGETAQMASGSITLLQRKANSWPQSVPSVAWRLDWFRQHSRHELFSIAPSVGIGPRRWRPDRWNALGAARQPFRNGASALLRVTGGFAVALAASSSMSGVATF